MYHKFLTDKTFFHFLYKTDQDLSKQTKDQGCPFCRAVLHVANYMRKPRGSIDLPEHLSLRFSFSCSRDGCRKRAMALSIRFLGRFVYWSVHVILISAMLGGRATDVNKISKEFCIDVKTIKRWRRWWKDFFPTTKFWKKLSGEMVERIEHFPLGLLKLFEKSRSTEDGIIAFLHSLKGLKKTDWPMADTFTQ